MTTTLEFNLTNNGETKFAETGYPSTTMITLCASLVFLMTPGLGFFYSGMSSPKNALSMILISMLCMAVVTVQWFLFGFSLSFSEKGSPFIGNADHFAFQGVGQNALVLTAPAIPGIAFALYQLQFAAITPAIIYGSVTERVRLLPNILFIFAWATVVYDVVAYWTWGARGWVRNMHCLNSLGLDSTPCLAGGLDFAGGGPVHVASGFAGLAYCLYVGKRKLCQTHKPHNLAYVFLGTGLLWFGWFGFNGGSALAGTPRAAMAAFVTTLAASCSGLTWSFVDYFFTKKLSGLGFCTGVVTGLVVITPASGFVSPWAAVIMGILGGIMINLACRLKFKLGWYDDTLDAFGVHGLGGFLGNILTGIFHQKSAALLDGTVTLGSVIDGFPTLLGYQFAGSFAIAAYSFVMSYILLWIVDHIPGMSLRYTEEEEQMGADLVEMGEAAYQILSSSITQEYQQMTSGNTTPQHTLEVDAKESDKIVSL